MTETKMTKKEMYAYIAKAMANDTKVVDFCNHEIELLSRKSASKTETKTQKENVEIMEIIVSTLTKLAKPSRISEIQNANDRLGELSNQKMSALLKKLVDTEKVVKTTDKKVTYFSIAN